jgi:hypothetical protein
MVRIKSFFLTYDIEVRWYNAPVKSSRSGRAIRNPRYLKT